MNKDQVLDCMSNIADWSGLNGETKLFGIKYSEFNLEDMPIIAAYAITMWNRALSMEYYDGEFTN